MPEAGKQTDTPSRVSLTACKDGNSACPEPDGAPDGRTAGAVSDFDRLYTALDSCETDITRVYTGIASDPAACASPTVSSSCGIWSALYSCFSD
jgi:hypothetical protein